MFRYPIPKNNKKIYLSLKLAAYVKVLDKIINQLKLTFRKILICDSLNACIQRLVRCNALLGNHDRIISWCSDHASHDSLAQARTISLCSPTDLATATSAAVIEPSDGGGCNQVKLCLLFPASIIASFAFSGVSPCSKNKQRRIKWTATDCMLWRFVDPGC